MSRISTGTRPMFQHRCYINTSQSKQRPSWAQMYHSSVFSAVYSCGRRPQSSRETCFEREALQGCQLTPRPLGTYMCNCACALLDDQLRISGTYRRFDQPGSNKTVTGSCPLFQARDRAVCHSQRAVASRGERRLARTICRTTLRSILFQSISNSFILT